MAIKDHIDVYKESGNQGAWERGKVIVSHESLQRFALIFNIKPGDFGKGQNICNFKS